MANPNKNFTMVYYYIPEDFDEADSPNVFGYFLDFLYFFAKT